MRSGRKNDKGKPDPTLMPPLAEYALWQVLAFGAKKYTEYYPCNCAVAKEYGPEGSANAATINGSRSITQTTKPVSEPPPDSGRLSIQNGCENSDESLPPNQKIGCVNLPGASQSGGLLPKHTDVFAKPDASSVEVRIDLTSTTTIKPASSAEYCVTPVTSDSGLLSDRTSGWPEHSLTCRSRQVQTPGQDNWRQVPNAKQRYLAAALRHISEYRRGNSVDVESELHPLAHAAISLIFVLQLELESQAEHS